MPQRTLVETVERERVHPPIPDLRAQQGMVRAKSLSARQLDSPAGSDPQPVLLVVDRQHPLGPATLGEERLEAIEPTDVEHAHPGKIGGQHRHAVALVARDTGVEMPSARFSAKV